MSDSTAVDNNDDAAPPKKMSIADRIAALNNKQDEQLPSLTKPKAKKKNAIADKIAALKVSATANGNNDDEKEEVLDKPKVGKLKPLPPGAVPIMFGAGPPTLLSKKQKEREERMNKLKQEAQADDNNGGGNTNDESTDKPKKLPSGAVQVMPHGGKLPTELLKKQQELVAARLKAQQEAHETTTHSSDVADVGTNDEKNS